MKKVVIGIDKFGKPYVVSCPKKVVVEFKAQKKKSFTKQIKVLKYTLSQKIQQILSFIGMAK
jgi:hypothetical protein